MQTTSVTLTRGEEKKHSIVYANKDAGISGFYIPKDLIGPDHPARIKITIEEATDGD